MIIKTFAAAAAGGRVFTKFTAHFATFGYSCPDENGLSNYVVPQAESLAF